MAVRIGFAGSRPLASRIVRWVAQNAGPSLQIVGAVPPPFKGWWEDRFADDLKQNGIRRWETLDQLLDAAPELVFSINYWKRIDGDQINRVPRGIVNLHHSYRLRFRGRYSTSWAILHARRDNNWEHGTTLHYVSEELDAGRIIDSWRCPIMEDDTAESLFQRVEFLAFDMFQHNFSRILNGVTDFIEPSPVSHFYGRDSNQNLEIGLDSRPEDVFDFVRAWSFGNRPLPYFRYHNRTVYLSLYPQHVEAELTALGLQESLSQIGAQLDELPSGHLVNRYFLWGGKKVFLHE